MSDELHIMSLVTLLDAVHTNGIAVSRVTGVTPVRTQNLTIKDNAQNCTASSHFDCNPKRLPVKVVHWVAGVT